MFTELLLCARTCASSRLPDGVKDKGDDNSEDEEEKDVMMWWR